MLLLELPNEVIARIFNYLGTDFLQKTQGRGTISKQWHAAAQHQQQTHVVLRGRKNISRLYRDMKCSGTALEWTKTARTLQLDLSTKVCKKDKGWSPHKILHHLHIRPPGSPYHFLVLRPREHLGCLKSLTICLSMVGRGGWLASIPPPCARAACAIAQELAKQTLPSLRHLDLTFAGAAAFRREATDDTDHACAAINTVLNHFATLQTCVLRLARVCPTILAEKPPDGEQRALEKLCIQLDTRGEEADFARTKKCAGPGVRAFPVREDSADDDESIFSDDGYEDLDRFSSCDDEALADAVAAASRLADDLTEAASDYVLGMTTPKMVRVLWPDQHSEWACLMGECGRNDVRRFGRDVLTGDSLTLRKWEAWDAAGQVIRSEHLELELSRYDRRPSSNGKSEYWMDDESYAGS